MYFFFFLLNATLAAWNLYLAWPAPGRSRPWNLVVAVVATFVAGWFFRAVVLGA